MLVTVLKHLKVHESLSLSEAALSALKAAFYKLFCRFLKDAVSTFADSKLMVARNNMTQMVQQVD
jgi:hypothetical protein